VKLLVAAALLLPTTVFARAQSEYPYPLADAYSTAVRFVKLDKGCDIKDKDPDAAYVAFECKDDDKSWRGHLELFRAQVDGHDGVRVAAALDQPHYVELRFLELYQRKLKDERGTPPPIPKKPEPAPPDGGTAHE
jgi:hypothetical protein